MSKYGHIIDIIKEIMHLLRFCRFEHVKRKLDSTAYVLEKDPEMERSRLCLFVRAK
jgi:hypothetical protein